MWVQYKKTNYEVSHLGEVRNATTKKELSQQLHYKGHLKVSLRIKNKSKNFFVHRLVAICFLKRKRGCNIVNHKDGIKANNYYTNLEWTTLSGNTKHAVQMGFIDMVMVRGCRKFTKNKNMDKKVKLVSITKSLVDGVELTAEDLIVYTARVSNPSNQLNTATADRLLKFLIKNKHWSPFEMADFALEIKTSRAIAAQILRHWSMRFQEFSQRYAEAVELEPVQLREAGSTTRQGSKEGEYNPCLNVDVNSTLSDFSVYVGSRNAKEMGDKYLELGVAFYKSLIAADVAKEVARMYLPLTTQTTIILKGNIRTWMFYFAQRLDPHAQLEHRQIAQEMVTEFRKYFPTVYTAFFEDEGDPR